MEPERAELVAASWRSILESEADLVGAFYARLLELEPRLEDLFVAANMESQSRKFSAMLDDMVAWLQHPDRYDASLVESGDRHRRFGVVSRHYRVAGEALLWAIERSVSGGLDPDTRAAWAEAYTRMARVMQSGRTPPSSRRSP
jgi:hemoglobin-like flavoprotein